MSLVYLNGEFLPAEDATLSIFDRGFLFADSVYEVTAVINGMLVDFDAHIARLTRSCAALNIPLSDTPDALHTAHKTLIAKNGLTEGVVYLQVTRGAAPRDFIIDHTLSPNLVMFTQGKNILNNPKIETGLRVMTRPDERWARRDIKTTQLLSQSLAKSDAQAKGFDDAWFIQDGFVTEGTSNNAFIVTHEGTILTRPKSPNILPGITRRAVIGCAKELGLTLKERSFTLKEAQKSREAFITSSSLLACSVVEIDGVQIGNGKPGEVFKTLRKHYLARV